MNIGGWAVTALLIAAGLLRALTVWLDTVTFSSAWGFRNLGHRSRYVLDAVALLAAGLAVVGSLWLPYPGLWGPLVLVFAVIWDVNMNWKIRYQPWVAPVELGLHDGARITLLGGSLGTLIAYVLSITH